MNRNANSFKRHSNLLCFTLVCLLVLSTGCFTPKMSASGKHNGYIAYGHLNQLHILNLGNNEDKVIYNAESTPEKDVTVYSPFWVNKGKSLTFLTQEIAGEEYTTRYYIINRDGKNARELHCGYIDYIKGLAEAYCFKKTEGKEYEYGTELFNGKKRKHAILQSPDGKYEGIQEKDIRYSYSRIVLKNNSNNTHNTVYDEKTSETSTLSPLPFPAWNDMSTKFAFLEMRLSGKRPIIRERPDKPIPVIIEQKPKTNKEKYEPLTRIGATLVIYDVKSGKQKRTLIPFDKCYDINRYRLYWSPNGRLVIIMINIEPVKYRLLNDPERRKVDGFISQPIDYIFKCDAENGGCEEIYKTTKLIRLDAMFVSDSEIAYIDKENGKVMLTLLDTESKKRTLLVPANSISDNGYLPELKKEK